MSNPNNTPSSDGYQTPPRQIRSSDNLSLDPNAAWSSIKGAQIFQEVPTIKSQDSKWNTAESDCTRIVCMSDTHGKHDEISVPKGDILLHGGDFTSTGEISAVQDLSTYFESLAFPTTICIAGNHDLTIHESYYEKNWGRFHKRPMKASDGRQCLQDLMNKTKDTDAKFYYLEDESCHVPTKTGNDPTSSISVYGSPWSPEFFDWAFNVPRGQPAWELWTRIPDDTDILITHGPPLGRGDLCAHGGRAGCYDLLEQIQDRIKPRLNVFGHIHEAYGSTYDGNTLYVNASNMNLKYEAVNPCIVIDLPNDRGQCPRIVQPNSCALTWDKLPEWFQNNGYNTLANISSKIPATRRRFLPSGNALLETSETYKKLAPEFKHAKSDLRRALHQIYAESF